MALSVVVASGVMPQGLVGDSDVAAAFQSVRLDGAEAHRGRWLSARPRISRAGTSQGNEQIVATAIYAMPTSAPWAEVPIMQPLAGTLASRVGGALLADVLNAQSSGATTGGGRPTVAAVPYRWSVNNFRYSSGVFGPIEAWNAAQPPAAVGLGRSFSIVATAILPTGALTQPSTIYDAFSSSVASAARDQGAWLARAPSVTVNQLDDHFQQINAVNVFALANNSTASPETVAQSLIAAIRAALDQPLVAANMRASRWAVYALPFGEATFGSSQAWQSRGGMDPGIVPPQPPSQEVSTAAKIAISAAAGVALGGIVWYAHRSR